jgi:prevent-host-death family protein
MKTAPVTDLKARLSRYLSRVKAGEEILVTEHKVPIARLLPIDRRAAGLDDLRDLERQGLVRIGSGTLPKGFWKLTRGRDAAATVRTAVKQEREEGW